MEVQIRLQSKTWKTVHCITCWNCLVQVNRKVGAASSCLVWKVLLVWGGTMVMVLGIKLCFIWRSLELHQNEILLSGFWLVPELCCKLNFEDKFYLLMLPVNVNRSYCTCIVVVGSYIGRLLLKVMPPILWCWWNGNRGRTFPPVSHYVVWPCDR